MNTGSIDSPTKECERLIDLYYTDLNSDLYYTDLNSDHSGFNAVMSKKEQKHDDSLLLQESSPASMVEAKQHRISNFFKLLDTTPSNTNDGRALKRKMISPVTASVELDSDPDSKDYPVMNISSKLEAYKDTLDINISAILDKVKEEVSISMDKFKKDILDAIDEQHEQLSNKLQVVQEQLTQTELSQEQHTKDIEELKKENYDLSNTSRPNRKK